MLHRDHRLKRHVQRQIVHFHHPLLVDRRLVRLRTPRPGTAASPLTNRPSAGPPFVPWLRFTLIAPAVGPPIAPMCPAIAGSRPASPPPPAPAAPPAPGRPPFSTAGPMAGCPAGGAACDAAPLAPVAGTTVIASNDPRTAGRLCPAPPSPSTPPSPPPPPLSGAMLLTRSSPLAARKTPDFAHARLPNPRVKSMSSPQPLDHPPLLFSHTHPHRLPYFISANILTFTFYNPILHSSFPHRTLPLPLRLPA